MKRFLLLGAIALMFTVVSCTNDDAEVIDVQKKEANVLSNESAKSLGVGIDAAHDSAWQEIQEQYGVDPADRYIPYPYRTCGMEITAFGGVIGHEIGQFGGVRFIIRYSSLDGIHFSYDWELCGGRSCYC